VGRQLLLFAEPLLAEGLSRLLQDTDSAYRVCTNEAGLSGSPQLVLWFPEASIGLEALQRETARLCQTWQPAPLLIGLPQATGLARDALLALPAEGLLEAATADLLLEAIETLLQGGRIVRLSDGATPQVQPLATAAIGLGQWLLISGLQQIDQQWRALCIQQAQGGLDALTLLLLQGQLRELRAARALLLLLHGPVSLAWGAPAAPAPAPARHEPDAGLATSTAISLVQRNAEGSWRAIVGALRQQIDTPLNNSSGQLLALEGLDPHRRRDLLVGLLDQLELLREQLGAGQRQPAAMRQQWLELQRQLRQQALAAMASPYVRLPCDGELRAVAETLLQASDLADNDPELPDPQPMLNALVLGQPLLVQGRLMAPDEPLAVLELQRLVANWLVRNAEQVAGQVLAGCAGWPELRRYLLVPELLSTRNLERLRNQLNAQQRWSTWLERPVAIYESRRQLLTLEADGIASHQHAEPRDRELRALSWDQQLVTLALESRDALAPQLQGLIRGLGRLVVVLLTQVIGRAIGLVGRGILQGMGRSLRASQ